MPLPLLKYNNRVPGRTKSSAWGNLEMKLNALPEVWQEGEVLCLKDLKTVKFKETATDLIVLSELLNETRCPCGASPQFSKRNGLTPPLMLLDEPLRHKRVSIYYRAQRYYCRSCRTAFRQTFSEGADGHRMTKRLLAYIQKKSLSLYHSFSDVALDTGVHEHVIRNLFTECVLKLQKARKIATPDWIAIDEVHPTTRRHTRCVISDPVNRRILDVLPDNGITTVEKWLKQLPDNDRVRFVSMDMYGPYKKRVEHILPDARIIADRYHVQNILNKALKEVLSVIRATPSATAKRRQMPPQHLLLENDEGRDLLVKNKYDLKIADEKISREDKKVKMRNWFREQPDIARAYTLKADFAGIIQMNDRRTAEKRARVWLDQVACFNEYFVEKYEKQCGRLRKKPFGNVLVTVNRWFDEILNYVDYKNEFSVKVTNAFAEYANNQIKQAHRRSNGYNFEVLRAKVIFGDFLKDKLSPHPLKATTKRGSRNRYRKVLENPNANIFRLRQAREDSDKMNGLIPNPHVLPAYTARFPKAPVGKRCQGEEIRQKARHLSSTQPSKATIMNDCWKPPVEKAFSKDRAEERYPEQMSLF